MKRYTFEVVVEEGNDEFWEELKDSNSTGCDQMTAAILDSIDTGNATMGMAATVKLTRFEDQ